MIGALEWPSWVEPETAWTALRVVVILGVGLPAARGLARLVGRGAGRRFSLQSAMVTKKIVFYTAFLILLMMVLHELGFHLGTLLGAAGIVGIALGFASQTSVSNIISGLFLISERSFEVGDIIEVNSTTGVVLSIDLLSAKVRTFDNRVVRIPNETLIKADVVNYTHFPIRRLDLPIGVAYKEDVVRVEAILREVADRNPLSLDEPEPLFVFKGFGDSALELQFCVWFKKEDRLAIQTSMLRDIKAAFDAAGVEIPFPHRTIYTGAVTEPFPVRIQED
ncbi:MAG: mechanosensitive ion channel family protein [Pseudomonadota bacterium]